MGFSSEIPVGLFYLFGEKRKISASPEATG